MNISRAYLCCLVFEFPSPLLVFHQHFLIFVKGGGRAKTHFDYFSQFFGFYFFIELLTLPILKTHFLLFILLFFIIHRKIFNFLYLFALHYSIAIILPLFYVYLKSNYFFTIPSNFNVVSVKFIAVYYFNILKCYFTAILRFSISYNETIPYEIYFLTEKFISFIIDL